MKKLFVTLHLRNITLEDDSTWGKLGRYECHAFAAGEPGDYPVGSGFAVNVIASKYSWLRPKPITTPGERHSL